MIPGPQGGRCKKNTNLTLSPSVIFSYLLKSTFGRAGWIVSVDDFEAAKVTIAVNRSYYK